MEFNATFLVSIISFVIFVYLMNVILYEPVRKIISERSDFINNNMREAEENKRKAECIMQQKEEKIADARSNAKDIYLKKVEDYKTKKNSLLSKAKNDAGIELEDAAVKLENVSNDVKLALKGKVTDLANDIVEKVIGYRSDVQSFDDEVVDKILYQ